MTPEHFDHFRFANRFFFIFGLDYFLPRGSDIILWHCRPFILGSIFNLKYPLLSLKWNFEKAHGDTDISNAEQGNQECPEGRGESEEFPVSFEDLKVVCQACDDCLHAAHLRRHKQKRYICSSTYVCCRAVQTCIHPEPSRHGVTLRRMLSYEEYVRLSHCISVLRSTSVPIHTPTTQRVVLKTVFLPPLNNKSTSGSRRHN